MKALVRNDFCRMAPAAAGTVDGWRVASREIGSIADVAGDMARIRWPSGHLTWEPIAELEVVTGLPWHSRGCAS